MLSSVRTSTSVILAGKRDSHRHSTTSFSEKVVVAEASYQMLEVLAFRDRERFWAPPIRTPVQIFLVKRGH